ncbi:hybrid sensor histidine kinase/response regulator [filamentous cyanobacterium LEGE 11480]|uniref:histidine kinase n=1 Tax=Romeriopsis navalis LEGE 11480 TaxID=2777977 RepID=A0A928VPK1_9CYAN|nr:hybrid sensor histidine kinase/response regulator [Romeriopsis navalis]MBE9030536.1 hybrid sensor histidine kinase/response regulator [Romeriopsis navalis LEGE 11480]
MTDNNTIKNHQSPDQSFQARFEAEVAAELAHLETVLRDGDLNRLIVALPAVLNSALALAQDSELPGLNAIVTLIQTALLNRPEQVVEVAHLSLSHLQQVQAVAEAGEDLQAVHPNEALLKIAETPDDLVELSQHLAELEAQSAMPLQVNPVQGTHTLPKFVTDSLVRELESVLDEDEAPEIDAQTPPVLPVNLMPVQEELSDSFVQQLQALIDEPSDLSHVIPAPQRTETLLDKAIAQSKQPVTSDQPVPSLADTTAANLETQEAGEPGQHRLQVRPLEVTSTLRKAIAKGGRSPFGEYSDPAQSIKSRLTDYYLATTVRVDLKRLTQLHNLVGELVTQENLAKLHNQQYQGIVDSVEKRFQQFDLITQELHYWLDKSQNTRAQIATAPSTSLPVNPAARLDSPTLRTAKTTNTDFDPLLLDHYNTLYVVAQSLMEELAQLQEAVQDIRLLTNESKYTQQKRQYTLKQVRDQLLRARMLPVADVLQRFPRMVRDLSLQHKKPVKVKLSGTQTLLDKAILEKLLDPLVHLVRNSFDHGIESQAGRIAQGKDLEGTIEIRAYARGNQTYIEVRDDGRGIDCDAIVRKIVERKLLTFEDAVQLSPQQLYDYIFMPGFSTTREVTELSGRGVGMDAVRTQVRQLKGSISIASEAGKGTVFKLRFPLTLTTAILVVFQIHNQLMALPVDTLVAVATASLDQIDLVDGQQVLLWQDKKVPLYPSEALLGSYPLAKKMPTYARYVPLSETHEMPVLILAGETEMLAIPVDRLLQEQELVVKPFGSIASAPPYFYGCTVLGDGSLVPVLDGQALITRSKTLNYENLLAPASATASLLENNDFSQLDNLEGLPIAASPATLQKTILVVDDSLTARHFLSMTLEKSGYQVMQAKDGREALDCLSLNPEIKAVFCDVEMPRMNGFEFLEQSRKSLGSTAPPVIMLTSRSSDKHVQTAQSLGAKSYLTKPYLEQELLQVLESCWS